MDLNNEEAIVSAEQLQAIKKATTDKIVNHLRDFLEESETDAGTFNRDVYDAMEATYSTPELKRALADKIYEFQRNLAVEFNLTARDPMEVCRARLA